MVKKILFMVSVYRGHLVPTISLAKDLEKHGYEVSYYGPERYQEFAAYNGVKYTPYPAFESLDKFMNLKLPVTSVHNRLFLLLDSITNAAKDIIEWGKESLKNQNIDLIIYDNIAIWGHVISNMLNIKSICSTAVLAINSDTILNSGEGAIYTNLPKNVTKPLDDLSALYPSNIKSLLDVISGEHSLNII